MAEVDVDVTGAAVRTDSVKLAAPSFSPYVETKAPEISRHEAGPDEVIQYRYSLQCVDDPCLPLKGPNTIRFPAVTVTATAGSQQLKETRPGRSRSPRRAFSRPTSRARSHISAIRRRCRRRSIPSHPAGSPARSPLAAILLAAAALALLGRELLGVLARRRLGALAKLTPLEAALLYLRQAAAGRIPLTAAKHSSSSPPCSTPTASLDSRTRQATSRGQKAAHTARVVELADEAETTQAEQS